MGILLFRPRGGMGDGALRLSAVFSDSAAN